MHEFDEQPTRFRRLRIPLLGMMAALVAAGWLVYNPPSLLQPPPEELRSERNTGEIRLADLSDSFDADGSLLYGQTLEISHPGTGTITEIATQGNSITNGDVLYRVDDSPTVAIIGSAPAFRTMAVGSVGEDVLQLEQALVEMGYDSADLLNVDGTFTEYTESLVELWQAELGAAVTGRVDYGDVVFVPRDLRISDVLSSTGDAVDVAPLLRLTSDNLIVSFDVPLVEVDAVRVGTLLDVHLPDRTTFQAEVYESRNVGSGVWTITAAPLELPDRTVGETPVEVNWERTVAEQTAVVSASALRRLDSGVFAVEVVASSDIDTEFVAVEVGRQSGSLVELLAGPPIGTPVIQP